MDRLKETYENIMDIAIPYIENKNAEKYINSREFELSILDRVVYGKPLLSEGKEKEFYELLDFEKAEIGQYKDKRKVEAIIIFLTEEGKDFKRYLIENEENTRLFVTLFILISYLRRNWAYEHAYNLCHVLDSDNFESFEIREMLIVTNWFNYRIAYDLEDWKVGTIKVIERALGITSDQISCGDVKGKCKDCTINNNIAAQNTLTELICVLIEKNMFPKEYNKPEHVMAAFQCLNRLRSSKDFRYSTFRANMGRIYIIMSKLENDVAKQQEYRNEARAFLEFAIAKDSPSVNKNARAINWKSYIMQIDMDDALDNMKNEYQNAIENSNKDSLSRILLITTFLTGFFALIIYNFNAGTNSPSSILLVLGSLIFALTIFKITIMQTPESKGHTKMDLVIIIISFSFIVIGLFCPAIIYQITGQI